MADSADSTAGRNRGSIPPMPSPAASRSSHRSAYSSAAPSTVRPPAASRSLYGDTAPSPAAPASESMRSCTICLAACTSASADGAWRATGESVNDEDVR